MTSRSVLVTGGSRGIGLATARPSRAGSPRRRHHRSTEPPDGLLGVRCDVTSADDVDAAFTAGRGRARGRSRCW
jgi:3-oxoacyl-[acyl-carrier protein] reductase